jgi:protein gp37
LVTPDVTACVLAASWGESGVDSHQFSLYFRLVSDGSAIEWTDATWNPVRGCTKVSPGCKHCYAETFAERFRGVPGHPFENGFDLRLVPNKIEQPLTWRRARRIFVNSMSDLFHENVPASYVAAVGETMRGADWHVYQVLTKRHERMRALLQGELAWMAGLPHVWYGVSVEDRRYGLPRLATLRETPAVMRFLSIEPLLEDLGPLDLTGIDWVIVGGESGPGARPMQKAWVLDIKRQCREQHVPFFFKQWGGVRKQSAGRTLNGRTYDEFPRPRRRPPEARWQISLTPVPVTGTTTARSSRSSTI